MIPASDFRTDGRIVRTRITIAFGIVALLGVILVARLGHIQIAKHQYYAEMARENRISHAPLTPIRGLIHDRNGNILAENLRVHHLDIRADQVADMNALLAQLKQLVALSPADIAQFRARLRAGPNFVPQTLRANLDDIETASIAVNQHRLTGARLQARLQRHYPFAAAGAHVVGYVGRISTDDLKYIDGDTYRGLGHIGRTGIEARYESTLRGMPGIERVETNAHGLAISRRLVRSPVPGSTVHLSLDIALQQQSIEALRGVEGAVVAIIPASGEVIAFASAPAFNPNLFVTGITNDAYDQLRDSGRHPLLNRALHGRYAPGSTVKTFVLLAGLDNGLDPAANIDCTGLFTLPGQDHRYRDWKPGGHGKMNAFHGLSQSCDVYFYHLAKRLGIDHLHAGMARFGFGAASGIDLPGENIGLVPNPRWKRETHKEIWFPGETIITAIGQGYMLATPLQLAVATATLANRGKRVTPRFVTAVHNLQNGTRRPIIARNGGDVAQRNAADYERVIHAMREVVHGKKGTARASGRGLRYEMAGKTGTAQVRSIPQEPTEEDDEPVEKQFEDHSLFIAFAPLDDPKIAIAVIVEHAGSGSGTAAPIARRLVDYYLLERLGMFREQALAPKDSATETTTRPIGANYNP